MAELADVPPPDVRKKYRRLIAAGFTTAAAVFTAGRLILGRKVDRDRRSLPSRP